VLAEEDELDDAALGDELELDEQPATAAVNAVTARRDPPSRRIRVLFMRLSVEKVNVWQMS
jgi:hypothetical protein